MINPLIIIIVMLIIAAYRKHWDWFGLFCVGFFLVGLMIVLGFLGA